MIRIVPILIAVVAVGSLGSGVALGQEAKRAEPAKAIQWAPDYPTATDQAKKTGKPIMIDFYTDWCGWCKVLDKETYTDPRVIDASSKMIALKINAEKEVDLAKKFKVDSYPRILFLSSDGKVVHEIKGYKPADQFFPDMQAILLGKTPEQYLTDLVTKGTDDPALQAWIGMNLLDQAQSIKPSSKEPDAEKAADTARKEKTAEALTYLEKAVAKLPDEKKIPIQQFLPMVYLDLGKKDRAIEALDAYRKNPKADPEKVETAEIRFAFRTQDRQRMEAALNRLSKIAKDEGTKAQIKQMRDNLDRMFPPAQPEGGEKIDTADKPAEKNQGDNQTAPKTDRPQADAK